MHNEGLLIPEEYHYIKCLFLDQREVFLKLIESI